MSLRAFEDPRHSALVLRSNGQTVRTFPDVTSTGRQSWTWNGLSSTGELVPEGVYTFVVRASDRVGNSEVLRRRVEVSRQRLAWRTMRVAKPASRYSRADKNLDGWVRASASRYSGGAVVHGGGRSEFEFGRAFFAFRLPSSAIRIRSVAVCAQGVRTAAIGHPSSDSRTSGRSALSGYRSRAMHRGAAGAPRLRRRVAGSELHPPECHRRLDRLQRLLRHVV